VANEQTMTIGEFRADLGELHHALGVVRAQHAVISSELTVIKEEFKKCKDSWNTPSAVSFDVMQNWLTTASDDLNTLLDDVVARMQLAYNNYEAAEVSNVKNLALNDNNNHPGREGARKAEFGDKDDHPGREAARRAEFNGGDDRPETGRLLRRMMEPAGKTLPDAKVE